jgi:hypothetical protein
MEGSEGLEAGEEVLEEEGLVKVDRRDLPMARREVAFQQQSDESKSNRSELCQRGSSSVYAIGMGPQYTR